MLKKILIFCLVFILSSSMQTTYAQVEPPYTVFLPIVLKPEENKTWLGPESGYVVCIASNPNDASLIYAGTWGAGVFKSSDAGKTWQRKSDGLGNLYINSFAIDPQNPRIMYAGTYKDGLYKSTDSGEHWYQSSSGIQSKAVVYSIAIDPYNPDIIFIGTRGENLTGTAPWKGIVYRSTNEGMNWSPVLQDVGGADEQDWAYDLLVNPKSHEMVFAATHEHGVFRSLDSGSTWVPVNSGMSDLSSRALSINPQKSSFDALYTGTWHQSGVFKSIDNAVSWNDSWDLNTPSIKVYNMDIDPINPANLYLANFAGGVYRTENAGVSWKLLGLENKPLYTVAVNLKQPGQIFAGLVGGGIYRSDDYGVHWLESNTGLYNSTVNQVLVSPEDEQTMIAATDSGLFVTTDGGTSWRMIHKGSVMQASLKNDNPGHILAFTRQVELLECSYTECADAKEAKGLPHQSHDGLQKFIPHLDADLQFEIDLMEGKSNNGSKRSISSQQKQLKISSAGQDRFTLLYENKGIYQRSFHDNEWNLIGMAEKSIHSLSVNPAQSEHLVVVDGNGDILITYDSGKHWQQLPGPSAHVKSIVISQLETKRIYAATDSGLFILEPGKGWQFKGLAGVNITLLAEHPQLPGLLLAGSDRGIYCSSDNGSSWQKGPQELEMTTINSITFDPHHEHRAYLGTQYSGIYRYEYDIP